MRLINRIVIHCSATCCNVAYTPAMMLRDHKARGFSTYGYHYYIRTDGTVIPLRPVSIAGAHAKGYNANSIGVCYEGGLNESGKATDTRTKAQKDAMHKLVQSLCSQYPIIYLDGHRDLSPDLNNDGIIESSEWIKVCPCFDVKSEFKTFLKNITVKP